MSFFSCACVTPVAGEEMGRISLREFRCAPMTSGDLVFIPIDGGGVARESKCRERGPRVRR